MRAITTAKDGTHQSVIAVDQLRVAVHRYRYTHTCAPLISINEIGITRIWRTSLLDRVNEEIKRRSRVVGIFPNYATINAGVPAATPQAAQTSQADDTSTI